MVEDPIIDGGSRDNCRPCFRVYYVILVHPNMAISTVHKCRSERKVH